jgi:hypothetical protein
MEIFKLDPSKIGFKVQTASKEKSTITNGSKYIYVSYIDARDVVAELNKRFGNCWSKKIVNMQKTDEGYMCLCRIIVKHENGYIQRVEDIGTESNVEKQKGAASDAFKRAAVMLGIGTELYDMPKFTLHAHNESNGTPFMNKNLRSLMQKVAMHHKELDVEEVHIVETSRYNWEARKQVYKDFVAIQFPGEAAPVEKKPKVESAAPAITEGAPTATPISAVQTPKAPSRSPMSIEEVKALKGLNIYEHGFKTLKEEISVQGKNMKVQDLLNMVRDNNDGTVYSIQSGKYSDAYLVVYGKATSFRIQLRAPELKAYGFNNFANVKE